MTDIVGFVDSTAVVLFLSDRELHTGRAARVDTPHGDVLSDILMSTMDIVLQLSKDGQIAEVRSSLGHTLDALTLSWRGHDLRETLTVESIPKFDAALLDMQTTQSEPRNLELNHAVDGAVDLPIRYTLRALPGTDILLLVGRDLSSISEAQQHLVNAQIELERDYEAHRDAETRFRVLLEGTKEAVMFVSCATGRITNLNRRAASLLGAEKQSITGQAVAQEFDGRRRGELIEALTAAAFADPSNTVSVKARRSQKPLLISPQLFRIDNERMLYCSIDTDEGAAQSTAPELAVRMASLFDRGPDAILFTDTSGQILSGNEAFLSLIEAPHLASLRGRSISDFFARGVIDMKAILENTAKSGALPLYATHMVSELGNDVPAEISASTVRSNDETVLAMVVRDARRAEAVWRPNGSAQSGGDMRSVMELVGSTTLKKIVADTTDMVEKMCIETAVELTQNNRVAAAEMLGLSRQSLYVKLRKYGLLSREKD